MLVILMFGILLLLIFIGLPVAYSVGVSSVIIMLIEDMPLSQLITKMFGGLDSFTVLAIPFYILVGKIMEKGNITKDLVNFSNSLIGHVKGGLAHVNILTSMFFAGISGSSTADSAAVGSMLIPAMAEEGYDKSFSAAVTASSSSIGPIIPPSLMMIIYASITGDSVGSLFLGGVFPGILLGFGLMIMAYFLTDKYYHPSGEVSKQSFSIKRVFVTFKKALWVLGIPLIIVGGIIFGVFTATEAGIVAVVYSLLIGIFVYKSINYTTIKEILLEAAKNVGIVLILLATASIFGNVLTLIGFPFIVIDFLTGLTQSPTLMLVIISMFFVMLGFFIDGIAIMLMFVPIMEVVAVQLGFDPIHFGVAVVISVLVGGITPPVGVLLFINCKIAKISFEELVSTIWPFVFVQVMVVIIVVLFPALITFLPKLLL